MLLCVFISEPRCRLKKHINKPGIAYIMEKKYIGVGTLELSNKAKAYVNQVMDSNRLSYGPFCKRLEKMFASIHNAQFGIVSNNICCNIKYSNTQ